jgi:hypothetical protein
MGVSSSRGKLGRPPATGRPIDEVGEAVARKGRARRFREARELKQGFDDGLFSEGERTLADVADDDEDTWDDDEYADDDEWDEDDPLLIDEGGRQAS